MRGTALRALGLLALAALPAAGSYWWHGPIAEAKALIAVDPEELPAGHVAVSEAGGWDGVLWIDARSAERFARGRVPGAWPLTPGDWEEQLMGVLGAWEPGQRVVVYCGSASCDDSAAVAERLRNEAGLDDVYVLHGGWEAWVAWREEVEGGAS
ncbi:MAG: rhodanese-like domain-containing protein [Planctomycetota bacterium]